jgi:hypothetical protein
MEKNKRLYPTSEEVFNRKVLPAIEGKYIRKRRLPKVSQKENTGFRRGKHKCPLRRLKITTASKNSRNWTISIR